MQIAWATDIHLNSVARADATAFCDRVRRSGASALLIGGDIAEAHDLEDWLEFLEDRLEIPIYYVLGNHDYYGSDVETVRSRMKHLQSDVLRWLPHCGCVPLTENTALVGHGGWGDARLGDFDNSRVILTDFLAIEDLAEHIDVEDLFSDFKKKGRLKSKLQALGDDAAQSLRPALFDAAGKFSNVIVLTHVPPFRESSWHGGKISDEDWMPMFTCKAVGDLLVKVAESHPDCNVSVLCGHTHGSGEVFIRPNLHVRTGEADYGRADFVLFEVGNKELRTVDST